MTMKTALITGGASGIGKACVSGWRRKATAWSWQT